MNNRRNELSSNAGRISISEVGFCEFYVRVIENSTIFIYISYEIFIKRRTSYAKEE